MLIPSYCFSISNHFTFATEAANCKSLEIKYYVYILLFNKWISSSEKKINTLYAYIQFIIGNVPFMWHKLLFTIIYYNIFELRLPIRLLYSFLFLKPLVLYIYNFSLLFSILSRTLRESITYLLIFFIN